MLSSKYFEEDKHQIKLPSWGTLITVWLIIIWEGIKKLFV